MSNEEKLFSFNCEILDARIQELMSQFECLKENNIKKENTKFCHIPDISSFEAQLFVSVLEHKYKECKIRKEHSTFYKNGAFFELAPSDKLKKLERLSRRLKHKKNRLYKLKNIDNEKENLEKEIEELKNQLSNLKK